jgi:predicted AlkP superfamily pyrophosphatase or phosphodiesterase
MLASACFVASITGVYFERIDKEGHTYGPNSTEIRTAIRRLDDQLLRILNVIEEQSSPGINLMLFSDHGMVERIGGPSDNKSAIINLLRFVNESDWIRVVGSGQIWPAAGKLDSVRR